MVTAARGTPELLALPLLGKVAVPCPGAFPGV